MQSSQSAIIPYLIINKSKRRHSQANPNTMPKLMGRGKQVLFLCLAITVHTSVSVDEDPAVKQSLLSFYMKLSNGVTPPDPSFSSWPNSSQTYCNWTGVHCTARSTVRGVALEGLQFNGTFDVKSMCAIRSLVSVSIKNNSVGGDVPDDFDDDCKHITHLYLNDNKLSGSLPASLSDLSNLKKIDISDNNLSGPLPDDFDKISGLLMFLAQNNDLSGQMPKFDFGNLQQFNVSYNNFSGPLPDMGRFGITSVIGNDLLCGKPLGTACPAQEIEEPRSKSKNKSIRKVIMYLGFILLGLVILSFLLYKCINRRQRAGNDREASRKKEQDAGDANKRASSDAHSTDNKTSTSRPDNSIVTTSNESQSMVSTSLVVVTTSPVNGLRFDDLLRAQAELLGRGRFGCVYKVLLEDGSNYAVKRIKEWHIPSEEFRSRMQKVIQAKHNNVLPPLAFYCAHQEKLVVYEYQPFGSLLKLLQGTQNGQPFDWGRRLNVASTIAQALAYMHRELHDEGIAHGNLKSSNIMMSSTMNACVSEYGLVQADDQASSSLSQSGNVDLSRVQPTDPFKSDVFNLGVILLELLTGKPVQGSVVDLASWVHFVVREEWTVEVFDKALIGGASEDRMVALLQAALDCVKPAPEARPSMSQVAGKIDAIKEEDDRSITSEG